MTDISKILRQTYDEVKQYQTDKVHIPEDAQKRLTALFKEGTETLSMDPKAKAQVKKEFVDKLSNFINIVSKQKHERHGGALVAAATAFLHQLQPTRPPTEDEMDKKKVKGKDFDRLG